MTAESADWVVDNPTRLATLLNATVSDEWPPEHVDAPAMACMRDCMVARDHAGWWLWFIVRRDEHGTRRLIGAAGYKGPPDDTGTVEVGYSMIPSEQNHGYATEAVGRLIERAWATPAVRRIIGETLPHLAPSIRVLEKLGFALEGPGSEEGVVRYTLPRSSG